MRRAAVLGAPIEHSLSPTLHRAAYAQLGLDWSYDAVECDEERLPRLLAGMDASWAGLSLTMPLKRTVLPLLDEVSELAATVGAANTVLFDEGRRWGDNTDVAGMLDALRECGVSGADTAVVLGAGGTAAAALAALRALGADQVTVVARDTSRAAPVREVGMRLGLSVRVRALAELAEQLPADLIVSTLPPGAADPFAEVLAGPGGVRCSVGSSRGEHLRAVLDVCYDPWPTALAQAARTAGHTVVGGFDLLLHQAAHQVTLMTGVGDVPVEAMRRAGTSALAAGASGGAGSFG